MDSAGRMEIVRELCSFERRLTGTDAERRAANRLAQRLRELGRRADVEPIHVHPQVGMVYAFHALVAFAGSLVAVEVAPLGFALVLLAATSMYFDLNARLYLLRLVFFRRASQNVVSLGSTPEAPARLVLSAHYDAARTGATFSPRALRIAARLQRLLGFPITPSRILFWSVAVLVPIAGIRMAGVDSSALSLVQLIPTLSVLLGLFGSLDVAFSRVAPGANDNASGVATVLSLAAELEADPPEHLDVWVVLTAAEESAMQGMRAFLRAHADELDSRSTYVVNVDSVGRGDVRYVTGEGLAVTYELTSRLTQLAAAVSEGDAEDTQRYRAAHLRHGFATDALPARLRRIPATTITCLEAGAATPANFHTTDDVPENVDPDAITRAHDFTLELIRLLDRDVGRHAGPSPSRAAAAATR
ncbi:MAG TPA: M20/M25/M40 family metallo-hydrolase [Solirubrobacterales bacterium]|nr:M20/M25/M40 family metallo-hydrolase [Solirubrobacterales bacterium]